MATVIINRTHELNDLFNHLENQDIQISIDGGTFEIIKNGKLLEKILEQGSHNLVAKIDWRKSPVYKFNLSDSETKEIDLSLGKMGRMEKFFGKYGFFIVSSLCIGIWILFLKTVIKPLEISNLIYYSLAFLPILLLYFLPKIIGTHKWISIEEKTQ